MQDDVLAKALMKERLREIEQWRLVREAERARAPRPPRRRLYFPGRRVPERRGSEGRRPTRRAA